jgi:putative hydrolase of the HAD superfamily
VIDGVVFDWGGTLTLPIEVIYEIDTWGEVARHLDPENHEELVVRLGAIEAELWEISRTTQRSAHLEDLIAAVVEEFGIEMAEESLRYATSHHLDAIFPHIEHDPDAAEVLEALRDRGLRIGLLSNTLWPEDFHEGLLAEAGIRDLIDVRLYTSHMKVTKPHPRAFRAALDALRIDDPGRAVFVGDRPYDDIHGAQRAGLKTVLRPNEMVPSHDVEPDAVIATLPDLIAVVDAWLVGPRP